MGIISYVKEEIQVIRERDPAIKSNMEVFLYPSFQAILRYRVAHKLYRKKHYFLARWVSQRAARKTGIEIHPGAQIGKGFFIDRQMIMDDMSDFRNIQSTGSQVGRYKHVATTVTELI